ncbi:MAG: SusC/RagA family TonB-linked outer membrane protein [Tannerella sp.]|jgi:TonB-linked SusC/RagA family outer membrane protein|nr:SusC/RagA family TonB-linked outer membrane protein [Tannerella sp.]
MNYTEKTSKISNWRCAIFAVLTLLNCWGQRLFAESPTPEKVTVSIQEQPRHKGDALSLNARAGTVGDISESEPRKITGRVVDELGEPVAGANIMEKGTTNGGITDMNGEFSLNLSSAAVIIVSYVGYVSQEINIGNSAVINVQLKEATQVISEIVVTALGIKREDKALGYAVQKVDGDQLSIVKGATVATSMTGKIAGLSVANSTEFNVQPSLLLRGATPLLVIDGVAHQNVSLADIPADDIESINVLKGSTASALYGSRGGSGAIMITTKKTQKEGLEVTVNSNTLFHAGFLMFPEVQNSYSGGGNGQYWTTDYVWGDKLDIGRTAEQYNPQTYEWEEMPLTSKGKDNYKNFLRQALVTNNNVSIAQKGRYGAVRTSLNHVYNRGQYPNNDAQKITFSVGGDIDWKRFHLDAGITYNKNFYSNTLGTGYGQGNYMYNMLIWTGAEYDVREYKDYWQKGQEHLKQNWMCTSWYDNPYFLAYERVNPSQYDLTNSYANLRFDVTDWLSIQARLGADVWRRRTEQKQPISSANTNGQGQYELWNEARYSTNDDLLVMFDKLFGDIRIDGFGGGSMYYRENASQYSSTSNGLTLPGFYSLNASKDPATTSSSVEKQQINSVYGRLGVSWKSAVFVEATGRNDWVSTLAESERSYFYPSVSGSVVLSQLLSMPDVISFWKIRGSWTQTKFPASVYAINQTYSVSRNFWGSMTAMYYPTTTRDVTLRPQASKSYELGTEFRFFNNRLRLDAAYYNKLEYDMQAQANMSYASGFASTLINIEEERLVRGVELTLNGDIVKTSDFTWNSTVNWAAHRHYYHKLDEMYSTKKPWMKNGSDYWWLEMYDWERDAEGNIIHYNGMPRRSNYPTLAGSTNPNWTWGWTHDLRYRDFRLNISLDGRVGGYMWNYMESRLWHSGRHIESDNQWRYDEVINGLANYTGEGVKIVSGDVKYDADGNITEDTRVFAPNDVEVSYEAYTRRIKAEQSTSLFLASKTFLKLREVSIGYTLPKSICRKLHLQGADIAIVGQNLLVWAKDFRYSDPDDAQLNRTSESIYSPSIRLAGVNLKLNF